MIELINVEKYFGDLHVLQGVNLEIRNDEVMVIIGPSGCGKSVLLKHIIGLLKPDSGSILIDGEDITKYSNKQLYNLRRRFGMLFQSAALFDSFTVGENVGLWLMEHTKTPEKEIYEQAEKYLNLVGLKGIQYKKPAELSGGMKKRVGLARAIINKPDFVLYDEPTTGLDPIMADIINELIIKVQNELKSTSIVVTHDMTSAYKIADRIAMLHQGKIIFVGTPSEVKSSDNPIVQQFIQGKAEGPIQAV